VTDQVRHDDDRAARGGSVGARRVSPDFRGALYRRYVSTFKADATVGQAPSVGWRDHKYLPLLQGLQRSAAVLEVGCGDGSVLAYLGQRGFCHAQGIDISAEQVELARARGVHAQVADLFQFLADQTEQFAAVLAIDVLEHLTRDELLRLAPLLYGALQPAGRVLIQTANGAGLFPGQVIYGDLTHMTIFTPQTLSQLLRPAGFADLRFYETGPVPIRLRGKVDVALWATIKALANAIRHLETGKQQAIWTENFLALAFKR
jgi:SAM-dependent methyltransferase